MKATVFPKAQDGATRDFDGSRITLETPSVVRLAIGPEQVARFDRDGSDLILVLKDGTRLVIEDFFVETAAGRHDLVFEDGNGVTWWAQYGDEWAGFDIAEINDPFVTPMPPTGALAGLGLLAGGAGLLGLAGGSAEEPPNTPPVGEDAAITTPEDTPITGSLTATDEDGDDLTFTLDGPPTNGTVTLNPDGSYEYTPDEDYNGDDSFTVIVDDGKGGTDTITVTVTVTPVNDPPVGEDAAITTPEDTPITGSLTATDVDGDDLTFTLDGPPTNGTVTLNPDGSYEYTPDADYNGGDSFTVIVDDGEGGTDTITVTVTVTPVNDPATITGDATGSVVEAGGIANATAGTPSASGTLVVNDVDTGEAVFRTPDALDGTYGTFGFDPATGAWSYALDNDRAATQALTDGEVVTDSLTVVSFDGTASETIEITVTGTNDVPVVTDASGQVTEDSDAGTGTLSVSGQVTIVDVDAGESGFDTGSLAFSGASHGGGPLGSLTIDGNGNWSYDVANALPQVQSLALGESMTESWEVTSLDGAATGTITITIHGTNDDPEISGVATGSVTEDATLTATGQLTQDDVDTSNSHVWSVEGGTGDYGTLTVDSTGAWTYTLDNADPDVQGLGVGATLTEQITVRVTDNDGGHDEQVVTITINGTNDVPEISAGSDLAGTVTELPDGDPDENTLDHVQTGVLDVSGLDVTDTHTVTAVPQGGGYLGTFSHGGLDPATGEIDWTFTVNDADLDGLGEGETLTQDYQVTVTDSQGTSDTVTVTVTIRGSNDRPDAKPDMSLVVAGNPAVMNVLANDSDDDTGETATLVVTEVDGQAIAPGGSITLSGSRGTVSLAGNGTLTFTPGPNAPALLELPYTIDDGSVAGNSSATALWTINSADVEIADDASPAGATTPDGVLSSVDDLAQVAINGQAAVGGSVLSLTISDGTNSVTVPASAITVEPDGSYSVSADLGGLDDGNLTVSAVIEDPAGNTVTTQDDILKDTVTTVTIDPVLVEDGVAPTITGTGEPGASVELVVDGSSHYPVVQPDGTWSVTLPAPLGADETVISASAVDTYGNTDTAGRNVTGLAITDTVAGEPEDILVSESGLAGGTAEGSGSDTTGATFVLGTGTSQLAAIAIGGTVSGGALAGTTATVTLTQLENAATTPVDVATQYGTLTITGFDAGTGTISYTYALNANTEDHSPTEANDIIRETIQVAAIETDGDIRVDRLVAGVQDDAPETPLADIAVSVVEGNPATGSANGGANLLANDTLGADGGRVHEITFVNRTGTETTVEIPDGGSRTVDTRHGSLNVASDGTWSYTPLASVDHGHPMEDTQLSDNFRYTTIDGDGDVSPGSATQQIMVIDTVPSLGTPQDASIDEKHLAVGTAPDATQRTVTGSLNLTPGQDSFDVRLTTNSAPAGLKSGGVALRYELSADGHSLTAYRGAGTAEPVFVVTLTDPTSGLAGYSFELLRPLDHDGAADLDLAFDVIVQDSDGDTDTAGFTVAVVDDAPPASITREIDEDSPGFTFNLSADATDQNSGIVQGGVPLTGTAVPGGMQYQTEHGTVTIGADGQLTYVPAPNFSGREDFQVTTSDDGTSATTAVTVNVAPVADAPGLSVDAGNINTLEDTAVALGLKAPVITDDATGTGNNAIAERIGEITLSGLPEGAILSWGSETHTVDASGSVTIVLTDPGLSEANATGTRTMTSSDFEQLSVLPPAHASENFELSYSVTSYEVDAGGVALSGVPGATSTETVMVHVQAVTDPVTLVFDDSVDASTVANADAITYAGDTQADVTLKEDTTVDLSAILAASFADLDGSENRSFTVTTAAARISW